MQDILEEIHRWYGKDEFKKLLGMKNIQVKENGILMFLPYKKELTNPHGIIHGGAIASLADTAMAVIITINYGLCYTKSFKIEFHTPAQENLYVNAHIVKKKMGFCIAEAEVKNKKNQLVAKAIGKYFVKAHHKIRSF